MPRDHFITLHSNGLPVFVAPYQVAGIRPYGSGQAQVLVLGHAIGVDESPAQVKAALDAEYAAQVEDWNAVLPDGKEA